MSTLPPVLQLSNIEEVQAPPGDERTQAPWQVPTKVVPGDTTQGSKEDKGGAIPQHVLVAPGLPTVSKKLAQRIWALKFIEMEEFLPTNKMVQSLESGGGAPGSSGTHSQSKQVADIITWVRCFSLYLAVMAQRRANIVAPMVSHLHAVIKLHQNVLGMAWLQYDWKARREMSAEPSIAWSRRDTWQLLSCFPGTSITEDLFDLPTWFPSSSPANLPLGLSKSTASDANQLPNRTQPYPAGPSRHLHNACKLFSRAPVGCPYGGEVLFRYRCTRYGSEDHGRRACPILAQEEARKLGQRTRAL